MLVLNLFSKMPFLSLQARSSSDGRKLHVNHSKKAGGEGGIRTLDTGVSPYNGLANRRLQPLGHLSGGQVYSLPCGEGISLPRESQAFASLSSY